jgi:hypothetical protein
VDELPVDELALLDELFDTPDDFIVEEPLLDFEVEDEIPLLVELRFPEEYRLEYDLCR